MRINLYQFNKVVKSTARVEGDGKPLDVEIKDECSITEPIFYFSFEPTDYNYIYVGSWERWYFISNYKYFEGRWIVYCTEDYLASWRGSILATRAMILYSSNSTKNIVDQRIPVTGGVTINEAFDLFDGLIITGIDNQGMVVLGVTGKGSFGCYMMDDSTKVDQLLDGVDNWWSMQVSVLGDSVKQLFYGGSAADCLKSAIALPLLFSDYGGQSETIYLGNYPCKDSQDNYITGVKITRPIKTFTAEVSIPWQYNDWRRNQPYSEVLLYIPFVGVINIPSAQVINDSAIVVRLSVNLTSGDFSVLYKGKQSDKILGTSSGNMAMATPFGSTGIDTGKLTQSGIAGIAAAGAATFIGAATGGLSVPATLGLVGGLGSSALGILSSLGGAANGSGGLGGGASHALDPAVKCYVLSRTLSDTQANCNDIMGKPYMGVDTLTNFTGYIQTEGFEVHGYMTDAEKEAINSLMDSGVYIE